jgi:hypothetical protein
MGPTRLAALLLLAAVGWSGSTQPARATPPPARPSPDPPIPGVPPTVILITVDTWRADRLGLYGSRRPTSRWLEGVARDGVVFDDALAPASWTWPSLGSLMSGVPSRSHGAVLAGLPLCASADTVAEQLQAAGWRTGFAGVNSFFLPEDTGMQQGFDSFWARGGEGLELSSAEVIERALAFVDASVGVPLFLHAHFFDPHCPYDPAPAAFAVATSARQGHTGEGVPPPLTAAALEGMACFHVPPHSGPGPAPVPTSLDRQDYLDAYDGELVELDGALERFDAALADRGRWDAAWVVITADHGEEFGEHGAVGHGDNTHPQTIWVPLVIKPPKGAAFVAGRRPGPVSLLDVAPTRADAAGVSSPGSWTGTSLLPSVGGAARVAEPVFSETFMAPDGWSGAVAWDGLRLVVEGPRPVHARLFSAEDLAGDFDLFHRADAALLLRARRLAGLLAAWGASSSARPVCPKPAPSMDAWQPSALERLGHHAPPAP